jgi:hypothetical protein
MTAYSVSGSGLIYPIVGHWAWGPDGFLYQGRAELLAWCGQASTIRRLHQVHTIGSLSPLAGAMVSVHLDAFSVARTPLPYDLTIAIAAAFLWFGWRLQPGSTSADFEGIAGRHLRSPPAPRTTQARPSPSWQNWDVSHGGSCRTGSHTPCCLQPHRRLLSNCRRDRVLVSSGNRASTPTARSPDRNLVWGVSPGSRLGVRFGPIAIATRAIEGALYGGGTQVLAPRHR